MVLDARCGRDRRRSRGEREKSAGAEL